ncbi:Acyloxyacyl hydrolase-like Protein [Tribolium castaneum]|uniref:Acyloxyacyl hydrolase-like Protein n=1 Tax=Tribolium castaneum TaxID=7070 RepID=D6WCY3_TRICA|nr:PREDICTED: acyloxyacyl hydrolase [Tribolium castaneum]EEZ98824.2 Acyloxyacyl hydrolase-like Protein [Tribolium castaneum]|eukprot:XP_969018.2 PREDICTED: acyloxyacyl hydrolase [Tribolium castaneum]
MKTFQVFLFLLFCTSFTNARGVNGGMSCAVCTVLTGVTMQIAELHEEDLFNATKRLCNVLPNKIRHPCFRIVDKVEPYLTNLSEKITPDLFCLVYGTCRVDKGQPFCHLFPLTMEQEEMENVLKKEREKMLPKIDFCKLPYIKDICNILNNSYTSLAPVEDFDNDGFSAMETGRGSDWRGRDCVDNDPQVYPGRRPLNSDYFSDSNCNGIWGTKNDTFLSLEQELCKKSQPRGLIFIGDSIGAHFHMPEVWINPLLFSWPGLNGSSVILDEIDWPQFGFATGFKNITRNILIQGLTDSLYLRLRNRNRCNHRDYQNLSQNGASSYEGLNHVNSIARNRTTDNPALVIYAMQGNDVCNNFNDTINHMTSPETFRRNVMKSLFLLDEKLPPQSHVVLVELVEADFIFPAMAERLHPIGRLHKNVFYKNLYEWFNCMQIGPCTGWLNANQTLRDITSKRARKLSTILKYIATNETFKNFQVHYIQNPINYLVRNDKINITEFLEPVDSLHPNQKAQVLLTETVWNFLEKLPVLGPVNPHNDEIIRIFGEQGGH